MNDRQEYLKAAEAFLKVQEMALGESDYDLYMSSVTAEGECYYMMNIVSQLKNALDKAQAGYTQYAPLFSDTVRLRWRESISKLAGSYYYCMMDADTSMYTRAKEAYQRCLTLIDSLKHTDFDDEELSIIVHRELLSLYYKRFSFEDALREADEVYSYYRDIGYVDKPRTAWERRDNRNYVDACLSKAMVLTRLRRFDEAEQLLSELPKSCDKEPSVLRAKGKIQMLHSDVDGIDRREEAKQDYSQFILMKKQWLNDHLGDMTDAQREQFWLSFHDFLFDCCRLEESATEMLYDLALFSKGYLLEYKDKNTRSYTWRDIQKSLDEHSCAIEFVQYNGKNERRQLAALVVTKRCNAPVFVHLVDVETLRQMPVGTMTLHQALTSLLSAHKNAIYNDPKLPSLLWTDTLMEVVRGARNIYFAADGILHQIAIEYMIPDTAYRCHRLTSTRMLAKAKKTINTRKALIIGDISYSDRQEFLSRGNDEQAYTFFKPYTESLVDLPGTRFEIDTIAKSRQSTEDLVLSRRSATDSAFRENAPRYPVVHVATHGYFIGTLEDGTDMKPLLYDNIMSQSGLAFAGSRFALHDTTRNRNFSDGLLSAKELSQIPLDSVDLIVLSACQTGLGYITADGVYGIQRALKQAGVRTMIVSLWSVNDEATSILMRNFYKNLQAGDDVYDAFTKARCQLIDAEVGYVFDPGTMSSKPKSKYAAPRYSNAFILIDVL